MTTTTPTFDTSGFAAAIERRDADAVVAAYADDAVLTLHDRDHPPAAPTIFAGQAELTDYYRDICGRNLNHEITRIVATDDGVAYEQRCRYPDGTVVVCLAVAELDGGRITRQSAIQVWDG